MVLEDREVNLAFMRFCGKGYDPVLRRWDGVRVCAHLVG